MQALCVYLTATDKLTTAPELLEADVQGHGNTVGPKTELLSTGSSQPAPESPQHKGSISLLQNWQGTDT